MIYTVTFNPSLDYVVHMTKFTAGDINRAEKEKSILVAKASTWP